MKKIYSQQEIKAMLFRLIYVTSNYRDYIKRVIVNESNGIDTEGIINIVDNPEEYNIDYLNSLDSAEVEKLFEIMETFGYI